MKKENILDILSFIIVIAGVILFVIFKDNMKISLTVIGCVGLLFGIMSIIKNETYGNYLTSIALMLTITMTLYMTRLLNRDDAVTFMIIGSFVCFLLLSALVTFITRVHNLKKYSKSVVGEVVDLKKNPNTKKEFYNVIYKYTIEDNIYSVVSPFVFEKKIPEIGSTIDLHVNPIDFEDVWFDWDKEKLIKNYIFELVFAAIGIVILVLLFI